MARALDCYVQLHAAEEGIKGVKVKVGRGNGHSQSTPSACLQEHHHQLLSL